MFLLSNLAAYGLDGADHPHATRIWLETGAGGITGALGLTRGGMVLVQAPHAGDWSRWRSCLAGEEIVGLNGAAAQVEGLTAALGLGPFHLWADEPLMTLDLEHLDSPFAPLRAPQAADLPLLTDWLAAYGRETGTAPPETAPDLARAAIERGTLRLLIEGGSPLAMAALNAHAGTVVQVGGVFTPPEGRGRGRAARVVAAMLAEARETGATRAVLFAASSVATAVYRRIGFAEVGRYRLALLAGTQRVPCH